MYFATVKGAVPSRRSRTGTTAALSIISAGLGVAWLSDLGPSHSACESALVAIVVQSACQGVAIRWYIAWGLVAVGIVLMIVTLIDYARSPTHTGAAQFCGQCGTRANAAARHCSSCGARLIAGPDSP